MYSYNAQEESEFKLNKKKIHMQEIILKLSSMKLQA